MGITTEWENEEKTILLTQYEGQWDLEDYYHAYDTLEKMMAEVDSDIVYIMDFSNSAEPPRRFLSTGRHMRDHPQPRVKHIVFIKASLLIRALIKVMTPFMPDNTARMSFVNTLDEAREVANRKLRLIQERQTVATE